MKTRFFSLHFSRR